MFKDATDMAEAVRSGQVSPKEMVLETIAKAESENPRLNAITSTRYEKALLEAEEGNFAGKPFAGVPIFLKDLGQEQAGEVSTSGSILFANYRAQQSDNYVKKLESLGFIVLGRTNTPEFGFKNTSDSQLHGTVNLPDDVTRNAGGSSGGAAALVASGVSPLAGASDGGGSIRIPASFNGLIGLKPTRGRIPVGPSSYRGWQGASVNFSLTKTIRDTKTLLEQFQICQMESPFVLPRLTHEDLFEKSLKPLRVALQLTSPIGGQVSAEAISAVKKAAQFLEKEGHEIIVLDKLPLDGIEAMKSYYIMNSVETAAMFDGIEASLGRQMTIDDMEVMTWAIYRSGQKIPAKTYSRILSQWDQYSRIMHDFHRSYDILLSPTVAEVAPKHGQFDLSDQLKDKLRHMDDFNSKEQQDLIWQMFEHSLDWTPFTQQANLTGQPSISLPVYRTEDGLSIGVQVTAAKGREDLLLQIGELFENKNQFM
ncbi:amidase [Streptococcus pluranimalium]|uniref:amidase n=1 Tax=Streptococcus pluranimalium TaxID=82348 RepID=UPI0024154184|nr:amidase [Streptococcus pluranimalium]WFM80675.1 amidase [Streptococcus pluranimalium]